jgi:hypothetical protein
MKSARTSFRSDVIFRKNAGSANINKRSRSGIESDENKNNRKNHSAVGECFVGSVIKARNNLLSVWFCGETQSLLM